MALQFQQRKEEERTDVHTRHRRIESRSSLRLDGRSGIHLESVKIEAQNSNTNNVNNKDKERTKAKIPVSTGGPPARSRAPGLAAINAKEQRQNAVSTNACKELDTDRKEK